MAETNGTRMVRYVTLILASEVEGLRIFQLKGNKLSLMFYRASDISPGGGRS